MTEKRFYIDNSGDLWDRQSKDILMQDFGYCEAIYVNAILDLLNGLYEENKELKKEVQEQEQRKWACLKEAHRLDLENEELKKENKELQERNNRQAKQLDDLYRLIEQKDWRALSDIMDDFKKAEEQLQSEWQTYDDEND